MQYYNNETYQRSNFFNVDICFDLGFQYASQYRNTVGTVSTEIVGVVVASWY